MRPDFVFVHRPIPPRAERFAALRSDLRSGLALVASEAGEFKRRFGDIGPLQACRRHYADARALTEGLADGDDASVYAASNALTAAMAALHGFMAFGATQTRFIAALWAEWREDGRLHQIVEGVKPFTMHREQWLGPWWAQEFDEFRPDREYRAEMARRQREAKREARESAEVQASKGIPPRVVGGGVIDTGDTGVGRANPSYRRVPRMAGRGGVGRGSRPDEA